MRGSRGKLGRPPQGNCAERAESRRAGLAGPSRRAQKKNAHPVVRLQRTHCERQWRPLFGNVVLRNNGPHCPPYMGAGQWDALNPDGGLRCIPFSQRVRRKKRHGEQEQIYGKVPRHCCVAKHPSPKGGGGWAGLPPPPPLEGPRISKTHVYSRITRPGSIFPLYFDISLSDFCWGKITAFF